MGIIRKQKIDPKPCHLDTELFTMCIYFSSSHAVRLHTARVVLQTKLVTFTAQGFPKPL